MAALNPISEVLPIATQKWVDQQIQNINNSETMGNFQYTIHIPKGSPLPIAELVKVIGNSREVVVDESGMFYQINLKEGSQNA